MDNVNIPPKDKTIMAIDSTKNDGQSVKQKYNNQIVL